MTLLTNLASSQLELAIVLVAGIIGAILLLRQVGTATTTAGKLLSFAAVAALVAIEALLGRFIGSNAMLVGWLIESIVLAVFAAVKTAIVLSNIIIDIAQEVGKKIAK